MAQYFLPFVQTPFFAVNSFYDSWQLQEILQLPEDRSSKGLNWDLRTSQDIFDAAFLLVAAWLFGSPHSRGLPKEQPYQGLDSWLNSYFLCTSALGRASNKLASGIAPCFSVRGTYVEGESAMWRPFSCSQRESRPLPLPKIRP